MMKRATNHDGRGVGVLRKRQAVEKRSADARCCRCLSERAEKDQGLRVSLRVDRDHKRGWHEFQNSVWLVFSEIWETAGKRLAITLDLKKGCPIF